MQLGQRASCAAVLGLVSALALPANAGERWVLEIGETSISLPPQVWDHHGVWAAPTGEGVAMGAEEPGWEVLAFPIDPASDFFVRFDDDGVPFFEGSIRHGGGLTVGGPAGRRALDTLVLEVTAPGRVVAVGGGGGRSGTEALILNATSVEIDPVAGMLLLTGDDVRLSPRWASAVGRPKLAKKTIGSFAVRARLVPLDGEEAMVVSAGPPSPAGSGSVAGRIGPDVIVGVLHSTMSSYGSEGGISAFAIGTTSCNKGDEQLLWVASTNQHPVIGQNMYRLKDDRFEQIGMSWLKHGFTALQMNACQLGCQSSGTGTRLGVGCSDPYTATLNGSHTYLGPRWEVNAHTGYFPYPPTRPPLTGSVIERRLQVHDTDLDAALNPGAIYFGEGHYVTPDDAMAGNGNNSASYARMNVVWDGELGKYRGSITGATQREQPAVRAWQDTDASVVETDVQIPGDGLFIVGAKAIDRGDGSWEYEYAVQNLNSDRSCGVFSVPLPTGAVVTSTGFHDVDYHSGEPYDGTDWPATISEGVITWRTTSYAVDPNANALRWGTLYNFRLEVNVSPGETMVTLGLFKPGDPLQVAARSVGPAVDLIDCNRNDVADSCDIDCAALGCTPPCGESDDCDTNGVPDDCEQDCNDNMVADACDIRDGTSIDCQPNGVPDECEEDCDADGIPDDCDVPADCDNDGIEDCLDLCRCSSDVNGCVCPDQDRCCFPTGFCIDPYPRDACLAQGGTPDCIDPCAAGCMPEEIDGDIDRDGDRDMKDVSGLWACYSGGAEEPGFVEPSEECRARFDFDLDRDVDHSDYKTFQGIYTGSRP